MAMSRGSGVQLLNSIDMIRPLLENIALDETLKRRTRIRPVCSAVRWIQ